MAGGSLFEQKMLDPDKSKQLEDWVSPFMLACNTEGPLGFLKKKFTPVIVDLLNIKYWMF